MIMNSSAKYLQSLIFVVFACAAALTLAAPDTPTLGATPLSSNLNSPAAKDQRGLTPAPDAQAIKAQLEAVKADSQRLRAEMKDLSRTLLQMEGETPACADKTTSVTKSGIKTDCWPRVCNAVTGLCIAKPVTSDDCDGGFLWDADRCVKQDSQCGSYRVENMGDNLYTCVPSSRPDCNPNHVWSDQQKGCVPKGS
jgi:hypothetical protein